MSTIADPRNVPTTTDMVALPDSILPKEWTLADVVEQLGGIPADRIRIYPPPGMAREHDIVSLDASRGPLCELIDGVLVEKTVGFYEAQLAMLVGYYINRYLEGKRLGVVMGADGPVRLFDGQVRMPDVSFVRSERLPKPVNRRYPAILPVAPDLAVEVISPGNSQREMERKLSDYFASGVKLVWYFYPDSRSVVAYTSVDKFNTLHESDVLDGGEVLPQFALPLHGLFAAVDEQQKMLDGTDKD
jgi:Uma2 family endonuclease